jgi:hypothetical protein
MSTKLSTITTQYRRFTKNQVLTEGHLNEIVDFFDDQDRLTRICLSGVGIVCGFKVSYVETTKTISITQGTGITSDGDLFHLYKTNDAGAKIIDFESKQYTHFKVYDNTKAAYKPFFYNDNVQLKIYELLTTEQQVIENNETFTIANLKAKTGLEIKDVVTILYLESYEKDQDLCVSLSCDNQGLEIIGNHRVLLVSKEVASQINNHDTIISQTNYSNLYHKLPDVLTNRIVLNPENFADYKEIKSSFTSGIYRNNVVNRLRSGLQILLTNLKMPILLGSIQNNLTKIFSFTEDNAPLDFQYRYDLLKDLIDTYNEIKLLLFNMDNRFCCPDIKSFPRHLMLGEIVKTGPCFEYRHAFYKSPLLSEQNLSTCNDCITFDDLISQPARKMMASEFIVDPEGKEIKICYGENTDQQRLYSLIKRAVQLLANYNYDYDFIKITPSLQQGVLGKKAIPFYNNVGNYLIELWDFDKTVLGQQRENISYHNSLLNTKRPLEISIDSDFYRIEGHQGRNYKEALKIIQDIRYENGLGFNVVVLGVNALEIEQTIDNYTSYYLNKNHGYEHKAGVAPGGTFVMIYIEGEYDPYYYGYEYAKGSSLAGDFEIGIDNAVPFVLNPIVADFTLPYLCCDENFITLTLPTEKICFDENTTSLPFRITPLGGFVKADVDDDLNGGVARNQYGEFVFDPKLVSEELIGKPISFTVNNIDTNCKITIFKNPKFNFTFILTPIPDTNTFATNFTIEGENLSKNKYIWDFGDGSEKVRTTEITIKHNYRYELDKPNVYNVTLFGTNGNCGFEIKNTITFEAITPPKVSIDSTTICRNDTTPHVFSVIPNDAVVTITGEGVSKGRDGKFVFIATNVVSTTNSVNILVNGATTGLIITLQNPPTAIFIHNIDVEAGNLVLINNSLDAERYIWNVAGEIIERSNKLQIKRPLSIYNDASIQVSLTAINTLCGQSVDGPRSIVIRDITPVNTCLENANEFVKKGVTEIKTIKTSQLSPLFIETAITLINKIESDYNQVDEDTVSYINGDQNTSLKSMFIPDLQIFHSSNITSFVENEKVVLRRLLRMHVSLFYTVLRCQKPEMLLSSQADIVFIPERFFDIYSALIERRFNPDKEKILKQFLTEIRPVFAQTPYITAGIDSQLNMLLQGEQF